MIKPVCIDFETFAILPRPEYPPKPVGVSIKYPGKRPQYFAWGHPTKNNCNEQRAIEALKEAWSWPGGLLFHNAKFDLDVAQTHLSLPMPDWSDIHDTMLLLFLDNPHADKLALKPSAERILGMPPTEQTAVRDWLINAQPIDGQRITKTNFGAYIAYAPGDLVGMYADGDVIRTARLLDKLMPTIKKRKMIAAYDRERQLIPILIDMERQGVRVDLARLEHDVRMYDLALISIDKWIRRKLGVSNEFNIGSGQHLVHALIVAGLIDQDKLGLAPSSTEDKVVWKSDKDSLNAAMREPVISAMLQYRSQLGTCLETFMRPWLTTALRSGGLIYTQWIQIRGGEAGARTGRFSSSPNFQNIPQTFKPIWKHDESDKVKAAKLPRCPISLPPLPLVRSYIIPYEPGYVLLDRDYSQQELRILAHFEDGPLLDAYRRDNWLDVHDHARTLINGMLGKNFERKPIKNTGFGLIYGMGIGKLAASSGITVEQAREVKDAYLKIFPGLRALNHLMKSRANDSLPIRTWGGREYHVEPPKIIDGWTQTYEYKMLNVLIQGSAADCTKEALIQYSELKSLGVRLLLSVHDEIVISAPKKLMDQAMRELKQAMECVKFDVPMLSEGTISETNWGAMVPYDKKGVRV